MSKFSKGKKKKDPGISTAALPDIVFMLLFFFMVTTVFKEKESKKLEIDKVAIKETIDLELIFKDMETVENPSGTIQTDLKASKSHPGGVAGPELYIP